MRATKTTIRFKLSRAEDARALEYLRDRKAAGRIELRSGSQTRRKRELQCLPKNAA